MRLVHCPPSPDVDTLIAPAEATSSVSPDFPVYELVRAACSACGTHTNALRERRVTGSCHNCGGYDLAVIEGAPPLADRPPLHSVEHGPVAA